MEKKEPATEVKTATNGVHTMNNPSKPDLVPLAGAAKKLSSKSAMPETGRWQRYAYLAAFFVLAYWAWTHFRHGPAHPKVGAGIPVGVASAQRGDIPLYLDGLGSVTAYYTDTIHSRVDGQLMSVNFKEGQYVHEGDVLAQIDPRPYQAALDQAKGQLLKDQALLADAKLDLERYRDLVATNAIPKQQYDTQVATVAQYEGAVKTDQASVDAAQLQLTYARITAPISGRVGLRLVDPGNIVHAADTNGLLVITQLEPISVVFTLPEDVLPRVISKIRTGAKLAALAYNRDKSQLLATGNLSSIDNQIDPTTGTSKLKAVFDNKSGSLFPNQFVNIRLLLETQKQQVLVPSVAVQSGSQGTFVYLVKQDGTVDARPVKVGITENAMSSIESGLSPGESVVVDGAENIQPGSKVSISAPNAHAAPAHSDGKGEKSE